MNKTYPSAVEALRDILKDGQKLAVGGFGSDVADVGFGVANHARDVLQHAEAVVAEATSEADPSRSNAGVIIAAIVATAAVCEAEFPILE